MCSLDLEPEALSFASFSQSMSGLCFHLDNGVSVKEFHSAPLGLRE